MKKAEKTVFTLNLLLAAAAFVGNFVYITHGGLLVKSLASGGFALMGLVNLAYAFFRLRGGLAFPLCMAAGLTAAMLGDIVLGFDFVIGAAHFAMGHLFYFAAQCVLMRFSRRDARISGILLAASALLLLSPLFDFSEPMMRTVCLLYALIIAMMTGKAVSDFQREQNAVTAALALGGVLFFFSDMMLVFARFGGFGPPSGTLCLATYYPAECLLAFSIFLAVRKNQPMR